MVIKQKKIVILKKFSWSPPKGCKVCYMLGNNCWKIATCNVGLVKWDWSNYSEIIKKSLAVSMQMF